MEIGSVLHGRYAVTARLGKGAMGTVYRAKDNQSGLEVALKVMAADLTFDPEMLERFRREGEALKQLRHPNIVSFVDMFEWEGQQVIVMEYVPGGSLYQLMRRGPLPVDQVRHMALDLCDALTRAHRLNIIHRDIKPENILLAEDGSPRLTDLGVARLVGEGTRLTGTGAQVGTPFYMSPEAWQGQHLDAQADIWSLGVVLYETLAGQVPFGGETMVAVMNKVLTAPLPDIKAARPDVPPDLAKIIRKMLNRDKAKRYQTMREVAVDLERLNVPAVPPASQPASAGTQAQAGGAMPARPLQAPRPSIPSWAWVVAAVAGVGLLGILAAAGGLGLIAYNSQQTARQAFATQTAVWAANQATQLALASAPSLTPAPTKAPQATQAPAPTKPPPPTLTPAPTKAPEPTQGPSFPPVTGELTLWYMYGAGGGEEQALNRIISYFMKEHPEVALKVVQVPFGEIFQRWEVEVTAGGGPDMFTAPNDSLGQEVEAGLLLDITDKLQGKLEGMTQVGIDGMRVNGRIYGVPVVAKVVALYYNKRTLPTPPATTDELLRLVRSGKKLVLNQNAYHNFGFFPAFGNTPWDESGKCVNTQAVAEAFQFLLDLKATDPDIFQADQTRADTLFRDGQADMIINGPWNLGYYREALGDQLGVAPMPAGPKGRAGPMVGIDGWFVNPNSRNVDAAIALALYLTNKDGQTTYANVAGDPPVRTDVQVSDPLVKTFADAAATGYVRPQTRWFNNYWGPFGDNLNDLIARKISPEKAASAACEAMNIASGK